MRESTSNESRPITAGCGTRSGPYALSRADREEPPTAGARARSGVSMGNMSALPADPPQREDPLDPERILRALPERERETFLAEYRRALDDARDPADWPELR